MIANELNGTHRDRRIRIESGKTIIQAQLWGVDFDYDEVTETSMADRSEVKVRVRDLVSLKLHASTGQFTITMDGKTELVLL